MRPPFDAFISDYQEIKELLLKQAELSFQTTIDAHFRKTFLISCASYHETYLQEILNSFLRESTKDTRLICFGQAKGIKRQYHTYFTWDNDGKIPNNINGFLGLFGEEFKGVVSKEISDSDELKTQMKAFLEIGNLRNQLAHQNLLCFNLEKTFDELIDLNKKALAFLEYLRSKFIEEK